jgi:hypothetical protein
VHAQGEPKTLFYAVGERLSRLIPRFGLEDERCRIFQTYRLICREALDFGVGRRPPEFSGINTDGTPIQLSLSFAARRPTSLQFVAEVGVPGSTNSDRIIVSRERMRAVAELCGATRELAAVQVLLEQMAPKHDPALDANRSGVFWIGVSFPPGDTPALTVYINSRWGSDRAQWERMDAFAAWYGMEEALHSIAPQLRPRMTPLGCAVTIARGRPATGRVYATAYGLPLEYYRSLFSDFCADAACQFAEELLGEDCRYPIRSTVCSFELSAATGVIGAKFELCAHCAFSSDSEAAQKCLAWLRNQRFDAELYWDTINILTPGHRLAVATPPVLHSYVGIGARSGQIYSSVYLNPGPPLRGD